MKMTVYVPDDLAAEVKAELGDTNVSAICQQALRDELARVKARAEITAEGFERIEVYDSKDEMDVAFQGRKIGHADYHDLTAYLTPKDAIAVHDPDEDRLYVYDDYDAFAYDEQPDDLMADVAGALGERYVRELDI